MVHAATVSVVVPARNEARRLPATLDALLEAASATPAGVEIVVVDNDSDDGTWDVLAAYVERGVKRVDCPEHGAARARNAGAAATFGEILVFVDADTRVSSLALARVIGHCERGALAGICRLGTFDGGLRARLWWTFWNAVRRLPLRRAKAMPAFMFVTRAAYELYGPFDTGVAIGEEWPILAGVYGDERRRFVFDRSLEAASSSRRMELQRFGYLRNFLKYVWAVLHRSGRVHYTDRLR